MHAPPRKILILDTTAFVAGFDPSSVRGEQYTVPAVEREIMESSMAQVRFKVAVESGRLRIVMPNEAFLDKVKALATAVGTSFLSEADLQIIALASQLKARGHSPLVVTDDYSVQNVVKHMGMEFAPLVTFGIRLPLRWIRYCPGCCKKYPVEYRSKRCCICGTELKRKPLKKPS